MPVAPLAPASWILFGIGAPRLGLAEGCSGEGRSLKVPFCWPADADGAAPGSAVTA